MDATNSLAALCQDHHTLDPLRLRLGPADCVSFLGGAQNWLGNYSYFCVKVHNNAIFHTKYVKHFLGRGLAHSRWGGGQPFPTQTLPPRSLQRLDFAPSVQPRRPRWLKPPHSENPGYVPDPPLAIQRVIQKFGYLQK